MQRLRPRSLSLLAAFFLLLAVGCRKRAAETSAPPDWGGADEEAPYEDADYARQEAPAGFAFDTAERLEAAPAPAPTGGGAGSTALGAPPPPPPKSAPARPGLDPGDGKEKSVAPGTGAVGDSGKDPQKQFARQIIYTAEMAISCFKLDEAMERAEALTLEAGGYVQTMSHGYFVLRIPAPQLRRVMDELAKLGVVESRSLQAQDVTQEYVDLTTRIRVLRETQTQLLALLKQARNVEEALQVRRSLDAITMELEQALGRLRMLENQIGFSTLTLRLSQRGPQNAIPSSNDPFPWVDTLGVEATEWN